MSHDEEKIQSIETKPEITQIIELVDKDDKIIIIAISHVLRKLKERLLRRDIENIFLNPQIEL